MIDYVHRLVLAYYICSRNYEIGSMGVGAGLYMYDAVVKTFMFAISSPNEFLFGLASRIMLGSL